MSLAPYAARWHKEETSHADAEEVVAREQRHGGELAPEEQREDQGVGGEERGESGGDNTEEGEEEED